MCVFLLLLLPYALLLSYSISTLWIYVGLVGLVHYSSEFYTHTQTHTHTHTHPYSYIEPNWTESDQKYFHIGDDLRFRLFNCTLDRGSTYCAKEKKKETTKLMTVMQRKSTKKENIAQRARPRSVNGRMKEVKPRRASLWVNEWERESESATNDRTQHSPYIHILMVFARQSFRFFSSLLFIVIALNALWYLDFGLCYVVLSYNHIITLPSNVLNCTRRCYAFTLYA